MHSFPAPNLIRLVHCEQLECPTQSARCTIYRGMNDEACFRSAPYRGNLFRQMCSLTAPKGTEEALDSARLGHVFAMAQTPDGYLWVGGRSACSASTAFGSRRGSPRTANRCRAAKCSPR